MPKLNRIYLEIEQNRFARKIGMSDGFGFRTPFINFLIYKFDQLVLRPRELRKVVQSNIIEINDFGIQISNDGKTKFYEYSLIQEIRIVYNELKFDAVNFEDGFNLPNINFVYNGILITIYYYNLKRTYVEVCKFLYNRNVKFKEYYNDSRAYLGVKPNYKEIQRLKRELNLDW